jgi:anhydro-N-acetylmuramic acid kinase
MIYRAIGLMSGSSLDGLDIAFVEFTEQSGKWQYEIKASACVPYDDEWMEKLRTASQASAYTYLGLHSAYGHYLGKTVNQFIASKGLDYQVQLVSSHGHTIFHEPSTHMTAQLGDGAAIAAETGINVVSDLRALDVALGGQGAPIVPIGEKYLFSDYPYLLNIGGISNLTVFGENQSIAFDIAPANRVLNMIAGQVGKKYDEGGAMAAKGMINESVLNELNALDYYKKPFPKSLNNEFGSDTIYPLLENLNTEDGLATYVEHIAQQLANAFQQFEQPVQPGKLLVTGGGAHNDFLMQAIQSKLAVFGIEVEKPSKEVIDYKEALIMAFIGVLRWRENNNALAEITGAGRNSIGGALWIGQEY